ncbi:MAG: DMT family transporter [Gemmobacter sp.]
MPRRDRIDGIGLAALIALSLLFGLNQVTIKLVNAGFNPVFAAAVRSAIAVLAVAGWMAWRRIPFASPPRSLGLGILMGAIFAAEFVCIYLSLDLTTVTRASVILYSMPVWFALGAHLFLPGERLTAQKSAGLALAFAGMALAFWDRGSQPGGAPTLGGDLLALGGALGWAAVALVARVAGGRGMSPEVQLLWMVAGSMPLLFLAAPAFGPLLRSPGSFEMALLLFQGLVIVAVGFLAWFWLLATYPPQGVASFAFLSPILGLALGWALLGEPVGPVLLVAGALVAAGLVMVNRPDRPQVPQKV